MKKRARILLIDDDLDFLESTRLVLESKYEVSVASSGEEGLKKARAEKPDVILLDIIMPATDGFSVAEKIKREPHLSKTPVLMLTSFSERVGESTLPVSMGLELEADDYIGKPVKPEELLERVARFAPPA